MKIRRTRISGGEPSLTIVRSAAHSGGVPSLTIVRSAAHTGFCMGVRRAVTLAQNACAESRTEPVSEIQPYPPPKVYSLGPLIHNPHVLEDLKQRGVEILDEACLPEDLHNSSVIIRAHGISPAAEAELVKRGAEIIDATCPHVKLSQEQARSFAQRDYWIFLAGEKDHAEIRSIHGYAETGNLSRKVIVVGNREEAKKAALELSRSDPKAKTSLLGQTTINTEDYSAIGEEIKYFFPDLEIIKTICGATRDRQEALRELCGQVDGMIIAGGRGSANTRRLFDISNTFFQERKKGKAWLIEDPAEISASMFADLAAESSGPLTIGLAAGASTPDETVDEIEKRLSGDKLKRV